MHISLDHASEQVSFGWVVCEVWNQRTMMCYDGQLETLIVVTEPKPSRRELARTITSPQC